MTEDLLNLLTPLPTEPVSSERQAILDAVDACKERNTDQHNHIIEVLTEYDPVGLIAHGAPADEYSPEAGTILVRYEQAGFLSSIDELAEIISEEIDLWFSTEITNATSVIIAYGIIHTR